MFLVGPINPKLPDLRHKKSSATTSASLYYIMGDAIAENYWEGEDQVDLAVNYHSDDEFVEEGDDSGVDAEPVVDEKTSKKRKKFEAMKEKKKAKLSELGKGEEDSTGNGSKGQQKLPKAFTVEEQIDLIESCRPGNIRNQDNLNFEDNDFVFPDLEEGSVTKSEKGKKVCPFVRALSANLEGYKKTLLNNSAPKDDFGCPILLVICSSAIRATQIIKSISAKLIKCKIAKLFAKHFKVEEQMEMLSKEYFPIALGTPNRVSKLIELGALSLRRTAMVLVDVTPDSKSFTILSLNEVKNDFYKLLYTQVLPEKSHLKIALIRE